MKYYWLSWIQPTEDHRPIGYPPREPILGWWCSGYGEDGGSMLCAAVKAESEAGAKALIQTEWPEALLWRFCEEKSEPVRSTRFPLADWMQARYDNEMPS